MLFLALPALARAQGRNAQITQATAAYGNFDSPTALRLLRTALDPAAGPADSAWGTGVQLLAQILIEDNKDSLAATWLRWAFRLAPALRIDSVTYPPPVVAAAKSARQATLGGSPGDAVTTTRYQWPAATASDTMGSFRTTASAVPVPVRVLVEGVGLLAANQTMTLAAGTYSLQAQADGYVTARVSREILPGTATTLQFALRSNAVAAADSTLDTDARARIQRQLVRLSVKRFGTEASCAVGAFVSADGLVLTTYQAIRGADALEAESAGSITVAAYDVKRNLAVLKLAVTRPDSLAVSQNVVDGQFAWGMGYTGCRTESVARTRVASWTDRPNGALQLGDSLSLSSQGGPLVDRAGNVLGLQATARTAVPGLQAADILTQARRNLAAGQLLTLADIGKRENHLYGSLLIRSRSSGAQIRVTPLEPWQWPELARLGASPLTFAAPSGRYQVALLVAGQVAEQTTATIVAGVQTPVSIDAQLAQAAGPAGAEPGVPQSKGKSKLPFVLAGGGGAAALAVVLLMPHKAAPVVQTTETTGSIDIHIPVNP